MMSERFSIGLPSTNMSVVASREMENTLDHLHVMLEHESSRYSACFDYLMSSHEPNSNDRECWRRKICEWSFEVVDHFGFDREVVSIALNYVDRVVAITTESAGESIARREFQLIAVTSLYLAIKIHGETDAVDGPRRKLSIKAFVDLSRGLFVVDTIETMERGILNALNWHMNPPTTVRFVASLLRLLPQASTYGSQPVHANVASSIFEMARYLTELAVCVSSFSFQFKSSVTAFAAVLCAIDALRDSAPLSYDVRLEFINNVAAATSLNPSMDEVRRARSMLMELCPSMFESTGAEAQFGLSRSLSLTSHPADDISPQGGSISPTCVNEELTPEYSQRKRGRQSEESP